MKIDVISDTVCPWCFVGKSRLERALAQSPGLDPTIFWHPFQLNPDMPREGMDRALYLEMKFGGTARAKDVYRTVAEAADGELLDFDLEKIGRTPNTLDSHRLIHFSETRGRQGQVVEALFSAYFRDGNNIGDIESLSEIAESAGLGRAEVHAYLTSDADVELIRERDQSARTMGVNGVPCFIINGKFAVSGAQDPEVFLQVFAAALQEEKNPDDVTVAE
jgi:predicted DsbA family dithiol-disulfide isomerase